jgi:hypothetical protein
MARKGDKMKLDTYENPSPGKTYISPSLPAFGQKDRTVRIASKVIDAPATYAFAKIKDELVLRHRNNGKGLTCRGLAKWGPFKSLHPRVRQSSDATSTPVVDGSSPSEPPIQSKHRIG